MIYFNIICTILYYNIIYYAVPPPPRLCPGVCRTAECARPFQNPRSSRRRRFPQNEHEYEYIYIYIYIYVARLSAYMYLLSTLVGAFLARKALDFRKFDGFLAKEAPTITVRCLCRLWLLRSIRSTK